MTQARLNHLMMIHCHQEITDSIDLKLVGASLSEPHTSELALEFTLYIYILYVLIIVHGFSLRRSSGNITSHAHAYINMCYKLQGFSGWLTQNLPNVQN